MKFGQAISQLQKEVKKKRDDKEVQTCLEIIMDKFCMDNFQYKSIELDIYFKDSFGEYSKIRLWDNDDNDDETNLFYYNKAYEKLVVLCKKLNKHGLKCKAIKHGGTGTFRYEKKGRLQFHTPWISVKI